ncbi:hypothetical protein PTSG_10897 [Salpingoeca rosetta]|uniref:Methyltransferase domain-containing protein n=1 Tax=Salpingoeca rosetta (strain ATCC 50818 / BSB-021) TaxID=946362 RepID=F2URB6_SALR5|nr:uncharacterized protein PTSG_10897 [Salpingoeca rosetta]EGD80219.1 hypothetical protein PTSG_10897 [Salpingoeca rosetta]|eukprot:XP_004988281.1 hypothetical protein PTSG_10897 [Salpingoeca rosetta]
MPLASEEAVAKAYDGIAKEYNVMMAVEVETPFYQEQLAQFTNAVWRVMCTRPRPIEEMELASWWVLDVACGCGNMLQAVSAKLPCTPTTGDAIDTVTAAMTSHLASLGKAQSSDGDSACKESEHERGQEPDKQDRYADGNSGENNDEKGGSRQAEEALDRDCDTAANPKTTSDWTQVVKAAFCEWARVLAPGAPLLLGYWVGDGKPYFEEGLQVDIVNHRSDVIDQLLLDAGFAIDPHNVKRQEYKSIGLAALHLIAVRNGCQS